MNGSSVYALQGRIAQPITLRIGAIVFARRLGGAILEHARGMGLPVAELSLQGFHGTQPTGFRAKPIAKPLCGRQRHEIHSN